MVDYITGVIVLMQVCFSLVLLVTGCVPSNVRNLYAAVYCLQQFMREVRACISVFRPFLGCRVVLIRYRSFLVAVLS